MSILSFTR